MGIQGLFLGRFTGQIIPVEGPKMIEKEGPKKRLVNLRDCWWNKSGKPVAVGSLSHYLPRCWEDSFHQQDLEILQNLGVEQMLNKHRLCKWLGGKGGCDDDFRMVVEDLSQKTCFCLAEKSGGTCYMEWRFPFIVYKKHNVTCLKQKQNSTSLFAGSQKKVTSHNFTCMKQ